MRKKVKNPDYFKSKFISKSIERHGDKYDYSKVVYINSIEKVEILCTLHGSFWVRPDAHITKVGCPSCNGGIKYDREVFIRKSILIHDNRYDYSQVEYVTSKSKVKIFCKEHGYFFMAPSNHLIGQRCPKCSGTKKKTTTDFINQSFLVHNDRYDYSDVNYVNNRVKVKIICEKHGIFYQTPKEHLRGHGCSQCNMSRGESIISYKLSNLNLDFKREVKFDTCVSDKGVKLPFDFYLPDYNILIEYDGRQHYEHVEAFGDIITHENLIKNDKLRNKWCSENNMKLIRIRWDNEKSDIEKLFNFISNNEIENDSNYNTFKKSIFDINLYLERKENFINFIRSVYNNEIYFSHVVGQYKCDIFLPYENIGFNFLGLFRDSDKCSDSKHQIKINETFKKFDFKLIQVFEDQWYDKSDIIKSRIISIISSSNRIYARKCELKEIVDNKVVRDFLDRNHLQGFVGSKIKIGLFYDNILVSLMTFGNLRKNLGQKSKENSYELLRFCNKLNTTVIGAPSKLFKYFIDKYKPNYIVSYADKMWSNNKNMYEKIGMRLSHESKPSYYYLVGDKRKNRFNYRKDKLIKYGFDPNLTEYEICKKLGIHRIYDCGTLKYEWLSLK